MNSLHDRFVTLHRDVTGRVETLTGERAKLIEGRQTLAAQRTELQAHVSELATRSWSSCAARSTTASESSSADLATIVSGRRLADGRRGRS
ncbi:hypothetical protein SCALM49S_09238 [Streptomyces californicus]